MSHVPVYAVTDFNGDAKAIQLENKAIVYFFMSSLVADTYKKMIQDSSSTNQDNPSEEDLTVSGMFLGKIWLDFIQPEDEIHDIEYRLIPDPRDLTAARTILSMETSDGNDIDNGSNKEVKEDDSFDLAFAESLTAFSQPFNDIPLFYVDNMSLENKSDKSKKFSTKWFLQAICFSVTRICLMSLINFKKIEIP